MVPTAESIWEKISRFRHSRFYSDVVDRRYLANLAAIHLDNMCKKDDRGFINNLESFLVDQTALDVKTVKLFLTNNPPKELRLAIQLFKSNETMPAEFLQALLNMKDCDLYLATHLLSYATSGEYIIYNDKLYEALIQLIPEGASLLEKPANNVSYILFHKYCEVLCESFQLSSIEELNQFLLHGYATKWAFE
ncbi:MAG: hypothetical protein ACFFEF_08215 [Candidatus Thorarchaeota archaeon]